MALQGVEQGSKGAPKLAPAQVMYFESPQGKVRCGSCVMAVSDTLRCMILGPDFPIKTDGVCYAYIPGKPMTAAEHKVPPMKAVKPGQVGYGPNESCGTCRFGNGSPKCLHPALEQFPINNERGCCNAHTPK